MNVLVLDKLNNSSPPHLICSKSRLTSLHIPPLFLTVFSSFCFGLYFPSLSVYLLYNLFVLSIILFFVPVIYHAICDCDKFCNLKHYRQ